MHKKVTKKAKNTFSQKRKRLKAVSDPALEKLVKEARKKTKKSFPKDFEALKLTKKNQLKVRCHGKAKDGSQCINFARVTGADAKYVNLYCTVHSGTTKRVKKSIIQHMEKHGLYGADKTSALQAEIDQLKAMPETEMLDMKVEILGMSAIASKLVNQKPIEPKDVMGSTYLGKRVKDTKTAKKVAEIREIKRLKSLQGVLASVAEVKKEWHKLQQSETNTVSREAFNFALNRYNAIIMDLVKDAELIKKIAERVSQIGVEMQERGL
jgi:hypothetical protein